MIRPYVGGFLAQGGVIDEAALLAVIEVQETLTTLVGVGESSRLVSMMEKRWRGRPATRLSDLMRCTSCRCRQ